MQISWEVKKHGCHFYGIATVKEAGLIQTTRTIPFESYNEAKKAVRGIVNALRICFNLSPNHMEIERRMFPCTNNEDVY